MDPAGACVGVAVAVAVGMGVGVTTWPSAGSGPLAVSPRAARRAATASAAAAENSLRALIARPPFGSPMGRCGTQYNAACQAVKRFSGNCRDGSLGWHAGGAGRPVRTPSHRQLGSLTLPAPPADTEQREALRPALVHLRASARQPGQRERPARRGRPASYRRGAIRQKNACQYNPPSRAVKRNRPEWTRIPYGPDPSQFLNGESPRRPQLEHVRPALGELVISMTAVSPLSAQGVPQSTSTLPAALSPLITGAGQPGAFWTRRGVTAWP